MNSFSFDPPRDYVQPGCTTRIFSSIYLAKINPQPAGSKKDLFSAFARSNYAPIPDYQNILPILNRFVRVVKMGAVIRYARRRVAGQVLEPPAGLCRLSFTCLCFGPTSPSSFLRNALTLFRCELVHPGFSTSSSQSYCT